MSGMVERVAKAIYEKRNGAGCKPWSKLPASHKAPYFSDAGTAIGTMMESITPAMLDRMEEMYMPFGEMRAAWDGAFCVAIHEEGAPTETRDRHESSHQGPKTRTHP